VDIALPEDPQVRELFLRAVREYSEACRAPELTADCPFSIDVGPGVRGCGEECMDVLAATNAPPPSVEVEIGDGISIRRSTSPRSRRRVNPGARPFDAAEIYLVDVAGGPPPTWRLSSLLHGLTKVVSTPPPDGDDARSERVAHLGELSALVEGRGLDFDEHVLPYLRMVTATSVFVRVVQPSEEDRTASVQRWVELASDYADLDAISESVEMAGKTFEALFLPICSWAMTASVDDLFGWVSPQRQLLADSADMPLQAFVNADSDGRWIVDRFTSTYLHEWATESLKREWKYLHGQHQAPCSRAEMAVREVDESLLAQALAEQVTSQGPSLSPGQGGLASSFVKSAIAFLREGRPVEAAALFEAIVRRRPDDAEALNNLGFCMIAVDPGRALESLNAARSLGDCDSDLVDVNKLVALVALGRRTSALDLAAVVSARLADGSGLRGATYLWDPKSVLEGRPQLVERTDFLAYVSEVVQSLGP